MTDCEVTELEGRLAKLQSEMDEIIAQQNIMLEEQAKMRALHKGKLEEARVLWGRLKKLRDERIARLERELHAIASKPEYALINEQPAERINEEGRGGAVAICGADAGNGDEDMEDRNQDGTADDEDEDNEGEDYDDEDDEDYDPEYDENEEDSEDEDYEDEEDAECEDEDDEHGDEDGGEAAEDEDDSGSWSTGSDGGGGEYPAYDDDSGSVNSDAYRPRSPLPNYLPW